MTASSPAPDYAARPPVAWTMIHPGHVHRGEIGTTIIEDRRAGIMHEEPSVRASTWPS